MLGDGEFLLRAPQTYFPTFSHSPSTFAEEATFFTRKTTFFFWRKYHRGFPKETTKEDSNNFSPQEVWKAYFAKNVPFLVPTNESSCEKGAFFSVSVKFGNKPHFARLWCPNHLTHRDSCHGGVIGKIISSFHLVPCLTFSLVTNRFLIN